MRPLRRISASNLALSVVTDEAELPPCWSHHDLFDSVLVADHLIARTYCQGCPIILDCQAMFERTRAESTLSSGYAGPEGTWAGKLYDARSRLVKAPTERRCLGCGRAMVHRHQPRPEGYVYHDAKGYCPNCYQKSRRPQ